MKKMVNEQWNSSQFYFIFKYRVVWRNKNNFDKVYIKIIKEIKKNGGFGTCYDFLFSSAIIL
jgi:hypothetical protein